MSYKTLVVDELYNNQVLRVTLNAPPANILTAEMMREIDTVFAADVDTKQRKLVIIRGAGKHFSFGASVEEHQASQVQDMLPAFHRMIGTIIEHPVTTLAQVSGFCLGGGFELALACSLIFSTQEAKFAVPEIELGVFPPVAASLLPLLLPGTMVSMMVTAGYRMSAEELGRFGLLSKICDGQEPEVAVDAFFNKFLLPKSASSLRFANRAARLYLSQHYRQSIGELEYIYLNELMQTKDANEGLSAFIGKRDVQWVDA